MIDSSDLEVVVQSPAPERLDRAIATAVPDLSRGEARRRIAAGSVFVNGRRCRVASKEVRQGDRIRIARSSPDRRASELAVLFQDDVVIAIDKPAGVPSAPTRTASVGTASELVRNTLRRQQRRGARVWVVHRLDTATSGTLLLALTRTAATALSASFRDQRVDKIYLALVSGDFVESSGRIDHPLLAAGGRSRISAAGKSAVTEWAVRDRRGTETLLELTLRTGRFHQLRAHLAAIGHPIVGDRVYGGRPAGRLMLHASVLRFPHPISGLRQEVRAPTPRELGPEA